MAKSRFIATILLPFGSSLRLSNYRHASNLLLVFPVSFAEADHHMVQP